MLSRLLNRKTPLEKLQETAQDPSDEATQKLIHTLKSDAELSQNAFELLIIRNDDRSIHAIGEHGYRYASFTQAALRKLASSASDYATYSIGMIGCKYPTHTHKALELLSVRPEFIATKWVYYIGKAQKNFAQQAIDILATRDPAESQFYIDAILMTSLGEIEEIIHTAEPEQKKDKLIIALKDFVEHFKFASAPIAHKAQDVLSKIDEGQLLDKPTTLAINFRNAYHREHQPNQLCPQRAVFRHQVESAAYNV